MSIDTPKEYFSCFTSFNQMLQVEKFGLDCFMICSRQNNCRYLKFNSNYCFPYSSLSFNELLNSDDIWFKNIEDKNFVVCTNSISTTTTTFRIDSLLARNYPISNLISIGFQKVYEKYYSFPTTSSDLTGAKMNCNSTSILCAAGHHEANSDILELVACGNCFQILINTTINSPNLVRSAYWYMTPGQSFGFSRSNRIYQSQADIYIVADPERLSWHLDLSYGGWRLGNITGLNNSISYKKFLFVKV
ncbi:unnamed protein product [Brachionus calyciflorus]|uniref:Uncharacterized protein n=1 Tax=Brachionus calyciflorus TaxID=104777 RepID=A0A814PUB2_9BILA|nr:unnamed protein product [Brachionus calyciflorus]